MLSRAEKRAWENGDLRNLRPDQVEVIPPDKCRYEPYDMTGSLKACGYQSSDTSVPYPIFPVPEPSYVTVGMHAADQAFLMLRKALNSAPNILPK
jgi:hypothetical protein